MAKKPQPKSAANGASADSSASPALATVILPEGLVDLMVAAAEAAKTLIHASAESVAKPDDADLQAVATGAGEILTKALASIEAWFKDYIAARLAAADAETERQLEEKRNELAGGLRVLSTSIGAITLELNLAESSVLDELAKKLDLEPRLVLRQALRTYQAFDAGEFIRKPDPDFAPADSIPELPAALSIELPEGMELITVIGPAAGLRRAGHLFNAIPNSIVVTAEQKALIAADPALSITDDPSAEAEHAARQGEKPAVSAFIFDPHGFTDVKVLGPKAGRRRIGHSFGPEASIVRVDRDELAELLADTLLAVGQA